ncbi:hypothetical protein Tco_0053545 [Tanacetum coccineum]
MDIPAISCPSCNANVESANHIFFECDIATDMWKLVFRWCDIPLFQASSWDSFNDWIISWHASKEKKHRFYVITTSVLWWLWRYRNSVTFNSQPLRKSDLFDNVRFSSFSWLHNRDHMKLSWNDWLMYPLSIARNGNGFIRNVGAGRANSGSRFSTFAGIEKCTLYNEIGILTRVYFRILTLPMLNSHVKVVYRLVPYDKWQVEADEISLQQCNEAGNCMMCNAYVKEWLKEVDVGVVAWAALYYGMRWFDHWGRLGYVMTRVWSIRGRLSVVVKQSLARPVDMNEGKEVCFTCCAGIGNDGLGGALGVGGDGDDRVPVVVEGWMGWGGGGIVGRFVTGVVEIAAAGRVRKLGMVFSVIREFVDIVKKTLELGARGVE